MDAKRKKALDRARKLAAVEEDESIGEAERAAFTRQLDKLMEKWGFTHDELFPEDQPEPQNEDTPGWTPPDWINNPQPKHRASPDSNGVVDAAEALDFIADLFGL